MPDKKKLSKHFENLSEDAKIYIESEIAYRKLEIYKKLIKATSLFFRTIFNSLLLLFAFAFLFIGLGLLIGYLIGYYFIGFLIISGFIFLVLIIMLLFGKSIFERKVLKLFNNIFSEN